VNNAPVEALRLLPGIDEAKALRIARLREELNGFASLHDLGAVLELDGHVVERLRDDTVFPAALNRTAFERARRRPRLSGGSDTAPARAEQAVCGADHPLTIPRTR
jgi:hypothetical protein